MPEADYSFKPGTMPEVRTFGQVVAHVAAGQFGTCAAVKGVPNPSQGKSSEAELKAKADYIQRLRDSFAFCDDAFSSTTESNALEFIRLGPNEITRATALYGLLAHDAEMYGIGTVYLRLKGLVPPSTERQRAGRGRGVTPKPGMKGMVAAFQKKHYVGAALVITAISCAVVLGQSRDERVAWNRPVEPFHVIGNVHYVGAGGVSSFLIATSAGAILLDGGLPETAPQIVANIAKLGFSIKNVKYLLNSHAHFDHAGGLAELKRTSGATLVATAGDTPALQGAGRDIPAVAVDRVIEDGETVQVGDTALTAVITPGHTKGCTTWTMTTVERGRPYRVVFYCSTSVVDRLVGNAQYPQIVEDYRRTFEKLRRLEADVFLANHPAFFGMDAKRERMSGGGSNPFVDPGELQRFVASSERDFVAALTNEAKDAR